MQFSIPLDVITYHLYSSNFSNFYRGDENTHTIANT